MAKEQPGPQRTRGGPWGHPHPGHTDGKAGVLSSVSVDRTGRRRGGQGGLRRKSRGQVEVLK